MRINGRRKEKDVLFIMAIILMGVTMIASGMVEVHGATTYTYTCEKGKVAGDNGGPTRFTVPSLKLTGVCAQNGNPMKNGKAKLTKLSNSSTYAKVAYYWGVKKGYDKKGLNTLERKKLTRMMQYVSDPKGTASLYYVKTGECKKDVNTAKSVKVPDTFIIYKGTPTNGSQNFVVWRNTTPISLTLKKTSTDAAFSSLGGYNFEGIKYQVYKSDKKTKVGVLTCKKDGTTNTLTGLASGTYYAKETATNGYYALNNTWLKATVAEGGKGTFKASDAPLRGRLVINKGSTDKNSITAGYDFNGIVYGIYASKSTDSKLLGKLTLNASGRSGTSGDLPVGTKYVREISSNAYYKLSPLWYAVTIKAGAVTEIPATTIKDDPVEGTLSIVKTVSGGNETDEEFVFELVNKNNSSIVYKDIRVKGDGTPVNIDVLAGEYILIEVDSGEMVDETGDQEIVVKEGETTVVERVNRASAPGSIQVRKTTDDGGTRSGFRFIVSGILRNEEPLTPDTLIKEADPQIAFTDEEAGYDLAEWQVNDEDLGKINEAAASHKIGDFPVRITTTARPSSEGEIPEEEAIPIEVELIVKLSEICRDEESGMYVGKATNNKEVENVGEGYRLTFNDFEWCGSATIYRDMNTRRDHTVLITNSRGYGVDETTGEEHIAPIVSGEYTVREVMTDEQKERYREPASQTLNWDGSGKGSLTFTFRNSAKTVPVKLKKTSIDGKVADIVFCLSGKTRFGDSIRRTGTTDENGNIDFGTVAAGSYVIEETGWDENRYANNHYLEGYERPAVAFDVTGNETEDIVVEFENVPYAGMRLTKRDKATGYFLPGAEFSVVNITDNRVEATFHLVEEDGYPEIKITSNNGRVSVRNTEENGEKKRSEDDSESGIDDDADPEWITINGLISGKEYRVVETDGPLGYGVADSAVEFTADHDEDAVVRFEDERSTIGTSAVDQATGEHVSLADDDVTIVDTVRYENLIPGKEYRLEGTLMNRTTFLNSNDTDDVVPAKDADGKEIRATVRFKPEKADGTVKVRFRFDGSKLGGNSLVVYEKLFIGDGLVTSHEDPTDTDQTIEMPEIKTNAVAERTGMHIDNASEKIVIDDRVSYIDLVEGVEYHLSGVLMDKASGDPIVVDGKEVRSEKDFVAESSTGEVTLTFTLDGRALAGTSAVAFEELKCNGKLVAKHKDIDDPSQTVEIPGLETVAERTAKNRIEDVVTYSGLIPGEKYVMSGVLMDKKTGKELEGTRSELEFSPEKRSGEIVIPFGISVRDLLAKGVDDVVAFERCDLLVDKEKTGTPVPIEIASHRDIDDEGQTVSLREPVKKTRTGEGTRHVWLAVLLSMASLAIGTTVAIGRKRRAMGR